MVKLLPRDEQKCPSFLQTSRFRFSWIFGRHNRNPAGDLLIFRLKSNENMPPFHFLDLVDIHPREESGSRSKVRDIPRPADMY